MESLNKIRKEMHQEGQNLSSLSDDLGRVLKPKQIASLLLAVEQVKIIQSMNLRKIFNFFIKKRTIQKSSSPQ